MDVGQGVVLVVVAICMTAIIVVGLWVAVETGKRGMR